MRGRERADTWVLGVVVLAVAAAAAAAAAVEAGVGGTCFVGSCSEKWRTMSEPIWKKRV